LTRTVSVFTKDREDEGDYEILIVGSSGSVSARIKIKIKITYRPVYVPVLPFPPIFLEPLETFFSL